MAWTTPRTWVPGEFVTASMMNAQLRDNLNAIRTGGIEISGQTAIDIIFASSASQLGRLAKGTALQVLRINAGATAFEFATPSTPTQYILAWARVANSGTPTLTAGLNIASLTDNGVGLVTVNFTTAISDASYAAIATITGTDPNAHCVVTAHATGSVQVRTAVGDTSSLADRGFNLVVLR